MIEVVEVHPTLIEERHVVVSEVETRNVVFVGEAGPAGPAGPQGAIGPSGSSALTRIADGALGGHRFVVGQADGTVVYADATNVAHIGRVLGMTLTAVGDGESVDILRSGDVVMVGWAWDTALPIYLGANGLPTQTAPSTGFSQIVGFAESPTHLFVDLREPITII